MLLNPVWSPCISIRRSSAWITITPWRIWRKSWKSTFCGVINFQNFQTVDSKSIPLRSKKWSRVTSEHIHKVWVTWNGTMKQEIISASILTFHNFELFYDGDPYHIKLCPLICTGWVIAKQYNVSELNIYQTYEQSLRECL